jgi:fibronectin-binding autotransporter adhesin
MPSTQSIRPVVLRIGVAIAALFGCENAFGQTNGTWITDLASTWGTASNWAGGTIPNAGGTATFSAGFGQLAARTVTNDVAGLTLGTIEFDTPFNYTVTGGTITMGVSGLTINSISSSVAAPQLVPPLGSTLTSQISGTGDLIKTGLGSFTLNGVTNNFIGNVLVNQGQLVVSAGNNAVFGNAANQITLNGGSLVVTTAALSTGRQVNVGANGGTVRTNTNLTMTGVLSGSGTLVKQLGSTLFLQANSTAFTGALVVQNGTVTLQNAGQLAAGGAVDVAGTVTIDNSAASVANRLGGRAVTLRGGTLLVTGGTTDTTEALGALTLAQGNSVVTVTPNVNAAATMDFAGLTRQNGATVFFRGTALGAAPAANVGVVTFQSSPGTLVGGGGSPTASTTASILPFAYGNVGAGSTAGSSFVTWDATTKQIVPLDLTTGYATDITTATANDNVNQNVAVAVAAGGATINSLRTAPQASMTISGGPITINSGAILATTATASALTTISAPVAAPTGRELVVVSTAGGAFDAGATGLTLSGVISGNGGLTKSGIGAVTITNAANTYTGTTAVHGGVLNLSAGTVSNDGTPSLLGQSTTPVIFGGSGAFNRIFAMGAVTFNRDIVATAGHNSILALGTPGAQAGESFTVNGNIVVNNPTGSFTGNFLQLEGNTTQAESVRINGNISGSGGLRAGFGAYQILNGNNSYTGGTAIGTSLGGTTFTAPRETWELGSDTALGGPTSPVIFTAVVPGTNIPALAANVIAGGGPRTIANPLVSGNGLIRFQGTNALTLSGPIDLNGNANIEVGNTNGITVSGVIGRGTFIKDGAGTMTLTNGANTYSGQTLIKQGVLSVSTIANGGVVSDLGAAPAGVSASSGSPYLVLTGGTLRYTGGTASTDRRFGISGSGGTIDASGTGPLSFTATASNSQVNAINLGGAIWNTGTDIINIGVATTPFLAVGSLVTSTTAGIPTSATVTEVGPNYIRLSAPTTAGGTGTLVVAPVLTRTLTLTGGNAGLNSIAGTFGNSTYTINSVSTTTNLAIAKTGPGTWQLTGASTYSGGTAVSDGTLFVNNTSGSGTGTGAVSVTGGTLGGTGIISGATTVAAGATIAPGTNAIGTLTVNNAVTVAGTYAAELNATGGAADRIVSNSINVTGATLNVNLTGTLAGTEEFILARNVTPNTTAVTGTFAGFANGSSVGTFGGTNLYVYYDQRVSGGSFTPELGVIILTPVPEPATALLAGAGLLAAVGAVRRRRRPA